MSRKGMARLLFFAIISGSIFITGCVTKGAVQVDSTASLPTIYELYSDRFEKTKIDMSYDDFKIIWSDSYLAGENNSITAYEIKHSQLYYTKHAKSEAIWGNGTIETQDYLQKIWFYFQDNKLIKYGHPEIWPTS